MTQSDMILEYIDGTLDPIGEQSLFDSLASQPELRATLRQFITIGDAVRNDREAFAPPAFVERSLLAGLGLTALGADIAAGTAGAGAGAAGGGMIARLVAIKGVWSVVTAFVVGAFVAGGSTYLSLRKPVSPTPQPASVSQTAPITQAAPPAESTMPEEPSAVTGEPIAHSSAHSSNVVSESVEPPHGSSQQESVMQQGAQPPVTTQERSSVNDRPIDQAPQMPVSVDTAAHMPPVGLVASRSIPFELPPSMREAPSSYGSSMMPVPSLDGDRDPVVLLEVRKQAAWSLQQNQARVAQMSMAQRLFTEDIAFGSYIRLDDHLRLGAEVGWDRFAQTLNISRGDTLRIEQQPKFFWGGLALRYSGEPMLEGIDLRPFLQATGGLTSVGPLLRTRLGTQWDIAGTFAMNLALEASSMVYVSNGQRQLTGRFGITSGLELGF